MRKIILFLAVICLLTACSQEKKEENTYSRISMEELAAALEEDEDYLLLDVRTEEEYAAGHIPGAVCLPVESIQAGETSLLTDKDQRLYVYCRSGNRSVTASESLVEQGFTNVVECGGIADWTGELIFGEE